MLTKFIKGGRITRFLIGEQEPYIRLDWFSYYSNTIATFSTDCSLSKFPWLVLPTLKNMLFEFVGLTLNTVKGRRKVQVRSWVGVLKCWEARRYDVLEWGVFNFFQSLSRSRADLYIFMDNSDWTKEASRWQVFSLKGSRKDYLN